MGFDIGFNFPVGTAETIDAVVDALIDEVVEPRKLAFAGSGHLAWEGMICTQQLGKCTDGSRGHPVLAASQGAGSRGGHQLFDLWYGEPA